MGSWDKGGWDKGFSGWGGPWPGGGRPGRAGRPGPPPWVAGLFGLAQDGPARGPRVRRGDVRAAILEVLRASRDAGEAVNGYQVIQQIADRSGGAWRPSPGSVYPTIQQLEDEGLVEADDDRGRRTLRLTVAGDAYVLDNAEELADVWTAFESPREERGGGFADLKPEIGQVMSAVWQIVTQGSERQRRDAVAILADTRRRLYGLLADGDDTDEGEEAAS